LTVEAVKTVKSSTAYPWKSKADKLSRPFESESGQDGVILSRRFTIFIIVKTKIRRLR
jgi:hypothetical protein